MKKATISHIFISNNLKNVTHLMMVDKRVFVQSVARSKQTKERRTVIHNIFSLTLLQTETFSLQIKFIFIHSEPA